MKLVAFDRQLLAHGEGAIDILIRDVLGGRLAHFADPLAHGRS